MPNPHNGDGVHLPRAPHHLECVQCLQPCLGHHPIALASLTWSVDGVSLLLVVQGGGGAPLAVTADSTTSLPTPSLQQNFQRYLQLLHVTKVVIGSSAERVCF